MQQGAGGRGEHLMPPPPPPRQSPSFLLDELRLPERARVPGSSSNTREGPGLGVRMQVCSLGWVIACSWARCFLCKMGMRLMALLNF